MLILIDSPNNFQNCLRNLSNKLTFPIPRQRNPAWVRLFYGKIVQNQNVRDMNRIRLLLPHQKGVCQLNRKQ